MDQNTLALALELKKIFAYSPFITVTGFFLASLFSFVFLYWVGYLKKEKGMQTGHTRKIFHIFVFVNAFWINALWGAGEVFVFGFGVSLVIFYAIFQGKNNILYEALAREQDEPNRTYYIVVPYFAAILGGILSMALFGQAAMIGYLVIGLGDAAGEIVGVKFGRHKYRINWFGQISERSYEGSLAVFLACILAFLIGGLVSPAFELGGNSFFIIPGLALICALIEAWSPHGWDNAILQIAPSFLVLLV